MPEGFASPCQLSSICHWRRLHGCRSRHSIPSSHDGWQLGESQFVMVFTNRVQVQQSVLHLETRGWSKTWRAISIACVMKKGREKLWIVCYVCTHGLAFCLLLVMACAICFLLDPLAAARIVPVIYIYIHVCLELLSTILVPPTVYKYKRLTNLNPSTIHCECQIVPGSF